jgi:pilus assembly protein CpaF
MSEINLLQSYLSDHRVTDVLIDGSVSTLVEREGRLEKIVNPFANEEELVSWTKQLLRTNGSRLDIAKPISEITLDSEFGLLRIHAVLQGECSKRTQVSIRRHQVASLTLQDLVNASSITEDQMNVLLTIIEAKENFVIIGGTGSGKTTLLKAMFIPAIQERVITIEDAPELNLLGNAVSLTTRLANHEGVGEISIAQLLREALRMRPDRLVVGEARGEELLVLLQAMNTSHSGAGFTLHANSVTDALPRMLAILAGVGVNPELGRLLVASSITWAIEVKRVGSRRTVTAIERLVVSNV